MTDLYIGPKFCSRLLYNFKNIFEDNGKKKKFIKILSKVLSYKNKSISQHQVFDEINYKLNIQDEEKVMNDFIIYILEIEIRDSRIFQLIKKGCRKKEFDEV